MQRESYTRLVACHVGSLVLGRLRGAALPVCLILQVDPGAEDGFGLILRPVPSVGLLLEAENGDVEQPVGRGTGRIGVDYVGQGHGHLLRVHNKISVKKSIDVSNFGLCT